MKKILLWGGLGLFLLFLIIGLNRSQKVQVSVGEVAPDFELISFAGESYQLSEFRGRVVVLNFWASWCETCKPEAEDLEAAHQYFHERLVRNLAADLNAEEKDVLYRAMVKLNHFFEKRLLKEKQ
mgnify:CR=1 FL=1